MKSQVDDDRIPTIWELPPPEALPYLRQFWWDMRREGLIMRPEPGVIVIDGDRL